MPATISRVKLSEVVGGIGCRANGSCFPSRIQVVQATTANHQHPVVQLLCSPSESAHATLRCVIRPTLPACTLLNRTRRNVPRRTPMIANGLAVSLISSPVARNTQGRHRNGFPFSVLKRNHMQTAPSFSRSEAWQAGRHASLRFACYW